jgi:hypothetical protein
MTRLAERLSLFGLTYFDGNEWQQQWPMELKRAPILVEVSLGAIVEEKSGQETIYTKQFFIHFPRNGNDQETEEAVDLEMDVEKPEQALNQS